MPRDLKLGFHDATKNHYEVLRPLTETEEERHAAYTPIFKEAENRLKLFHILTLNYEAWKKFTGSLLQVHEPVEHPMLIADQLLFNFLAAAYGITEHFKVSFRQRFKKDPVRLQEYRDFLDRLCKGEWAVAFFFDFRNYVQHIGLPIGRYEKHSTHREVTITLCHDSASLVNDYTEWKRSKLTASHGELDLIKLSQDYYVRMKQDYGRYVVKTFYPELKEIQSFYSGLTVEATGGLHGRRMIFFEKMETDGDGGSVSLIQAPNNPLEEIGIVISPRGI